ncbi:MAG: hypothetical protein AAFY71_09150 [Bacteroidota bacterium]
MFFQVASILLGFVMVPVTLTFLDDNTAAHGVWMVLSSFIAYFNFLDIGLGNGMRNKFAESKAKGDTEMARIYVSTTYVGLGIIMGVFFIILCIIIPIVPWQVVFNSDLPEAELSAAVFIVMGFFCIRFVIQLISKLLIADQQPGWTKGFKFFINLIAISAIAVMTYFMEGDLVKLSLVMSITPILVLGSVSVVLYSGKYAKYAPTREFFRREHLQSLVSLGGKFFLLQIGSIILFTTDGLIATQLFGPEEAFNYMVTQRLFRAPTFAFATITNTLWSAFTDAYTKGDLKWIRNTIKRSIQIWALFSLGIILLMFVAIPFIEIWTKGKAVITIDLVICMGLFQIILNLNSIFVAFVNGVGKVKLQLWSAYFAMIANIPLSIFLGGYLGWGLSGIVVATMISIGIDVVIRPIQYRKIMNGTAKGIWNE